MKCVGIFGGSFNPIHEGHIAMADVAHHELGAEIWLMPTIQNRLKLVTGMESFEDRYNLCEIAAKGREDWLKVIDCEQRYNDNRTLNVLRRLRAEYPDHTFIWLMGSDSFAQLPQWHGWQDLAREFPIGVFNRPDQYDMTTGLKDVAPELMTFQLGSEENFFNRTGWVVLNHPNKKLSSTEIRRALCHDETPDGISSLELSYIKSHKLYRKDSWYVPDIQDSEIESLVHQIGVMPTLYDPKNIYAAAGSNSFQACNDLMKYTGESIRDVVALRPERAALHDLVVMLSTQFKIKDYEDLKKKTAALYAEVVVPLINAAANKFEAIERTAQQMADQYEQDRLTDALPNLAKERLGQAQRHTEWSNLASSDQYEIEQRIIINSILREQVEAATALIVDAILQDQEIQAQYSLHALDLHQPETRQVFLVTGGPAVGKGRVTKAINDGELGMPAVDLEDFCKNNPDFYKEIILSPDNLGPYLPYYGSLAHHESFLISDKIYLAWQKMSQAGSAPNIFLDTARPHPWIMDILSSGQSPIHIFMTTCDVEKALERNYARGLETKRFMPTKLLLTFHQCEADMLADAIKQHDPHVLLIDTNAASPTLAARKNPGEDFRIYSDSTWQRFQNSRKININAMNARELYSPANSGIAGRPALLPV